MMARRSRRVMAPQILDFRFWILDCGAQLALGLFQNRKSKIQNCSSRAAETMERSAERSLDMARRMNDRARSRMVSSLPTIASAKLRVRSARWPPVAQRAPTPEERGGL